MIAMAADFAVSYDVIDGVEIETLKLMPQHLLIRWGDRKETKGGIIMPQNRQRAGIMKGTLLKIGADCDPRFEVGQTVQFIGLCEKEFLGGETPGDRDPVFFMREENVVGIHRGPGDLEIVNEFLFIEQDQEAEEKAGIKIVNREQKTIMRSGVVIRADNNLPPEDVAAGNRVFYHSSSADDLKLGDFEGQLVHVVRWRFVEMVAEENKGVS